MKYFTKHENSDLAWWIDAEVLSADTHVKWKAVACSRIKENPVKKDVFFQNYFCSIELFLDLIKRGIISKIKRSKLTKESSIMDWAWKEIKKTEKASASYISFALSDEDDDYLDKYRSPNQDLWYEIIIYKISNSILFDLNLWGYKYQLQGLTLSKDAFYIFTDRLNDVCFRFLTDWSGLDELTSQLKFYLKKTKSLQSIKEDLEKELLKVDSFSNDYESISANMLRLLERLLRDIRMSKNWKFSAKNIDSLVNGFINVGVLNEEQRQLLTLISKPYRDYVLHGNRLAFTVAKLLLTSCLEIFLKLGNHFDNTLYSQVSA